MTEYKEDKLLLSEPLIRWIKTFKYDVIGSDFRNLSQFIGSEFLDDVITLITESRKQSRSSSGLILSTVADRLHHLRKILRQISDFYNSKLQQVVMLPAPNLVNISESLLFEDCKDDVKQFLLLILGCATQCDMKDTFIARMSELLDKSDQERIEENFELLADNSMAADSSTLGLDDNMLHMHNQVSRLTDERGLYAEKYYDCYEKHSTSAFENGYSHDALPILVKPVVPVDHGGQWNYLYSRQSGQFDSERNEEDVLVLRYRPKVKVIKGADEPIPAGLTESDKNKLSLAEEKIKENEELQKQLYDMKQNLREMEFYQKKNKELHSENAKLVANEQKFKDQLETSRRKEEDMVERLVDCQIKLDDAVGEREMDRRKIAELLQSRGKGGSDGLDDLVSESEGESGGKGAKNKRIQELEREIESLRTRLMDAQKQDNQSDEKWKFLELQKEKMEARRQLKEAVDENDNLRRAIDKLENQVTRAEEQLQEAQDVANVTRTANDEQVAQFEERITELTRQVNLLRKKGGKLSGDQFRDLERQEGAAMYETIQELTSEVTKLKTHNKILRQECDKLKRDVEKVVSMERENERLADDNDALQRALASRDGNSELSDELRRQNLQLSIENKKLRRMIDTLRFTLMQVDPYNKQKYNYITSI